MKCVEENDKYLLSVERNMYEMCFINFAISLAN